VGLDAGSSHTLLYVYKWPAEKHDGTGIVEQVVKCPSSPHSQCSYRSVINIRMCKTHSVLVASLLALSLQKSLQCHGFHVFLFKNSCHCLGEPGYAAVSHLLYVLYPVCVAILSK